MVTAIVLINTHHGRINEVAEALAELGGIFRGLLRGRQLRHSRHPASRTPTRASADMVTNRMIRIEGIEHTETMIAFKTYSRHDLEEIFSIGMGS